jgi:hypothetical protein
VYTRASELSSSVQVFAGLPVDLPRGFVRLVYSIGYGEDSLLDQAVTSPRNSGTPQFWKIFQSCIAKPGTIPDYGIVQKIRTRDSMIRLRNKILVLERLRESAVWLVDASLAALYLPGQEKPSARLRKEVLETSWDAYVGGVVESSEPTAILCIGVGVARSLRTRLDKLGVAWRAVHQPQDRLSSQEHARIHASYSEICDEPRNVGLLPSVI